MVAAAIAGAAVVSAGAGIAGSQMQADAAGDAAAASGNATALSVAEQRRQYDQSRRDLQPYRSVGTSALNELAALYGLPAYKQIAGNVFEETIRPYVDQNGITQGGIYDIPGYGKVRLENKDNVINEAYDITGGTPELQEAALSRFKASPDYEFALDEGLRAMDRSAAARGNLLSGGYGREITRYGQGLATTNYNNYVNRLSSLAGAGQAAAGTGAQIGANAAANIGNTLQAGAQMQGNALTDAATARASGYTAAANSANSAAQNYMFYNALGKAA